MLSWPHYLGQSVSLVFWELLFFFFFPLLHCVHVKPPQPGIEPMPSALEAWSRNHWTTREAQNIALFFFFFNSEKVLLI